MQSKLILIEGLPGAGKTTVARIVQDILRPHKESLKVYLEGNPEHPADFDGTAVCTAAEREEILASWPEQAALLRNNFRNQGDSWYIRYGALHRVLPPQMMKRFSQLDVYELPFDVHANLMQHRWRSFATAAMGQSTTWLFECSFLQNPLTIGMISQNRSHEEITAHIHALQEIIRPLNPLLIYLSLDDIATAFTKVASQRPQAWRDFFIDYYTNREYGKSLWLRGTAGTIAALRDRYQLERDILRGLDMPVIMLQPSREHSSTTDALKVQLLPYL
jgi:hypothetical protein